MEPTKKVLIIAYVFPPIAYVGTYRTLRFCRYLPENGWEPHVLTINVASDLDNDFKLLDRLPQEVRIHRTMTIDFWRMRRKKKENSASRNGSATSTKTQKLRPTLLSKINDFLWAFVTTPDHMVFWVPFATIKGIRLFFSEKFSVIYTSSPPHSEHLIGYFLAKLFRARWVADFRDPMLDSSGYVPSPMRRKIDAFLEHLVINNANRVIIISKDYQQKIQARYPEAHDKFIVLPNGYDPDLYINAPIGYFDKFTILYAGSFYANRKPDFFLHGIGQWVALHPEVRSNVQVLFYGLESKEAKAIVERKKLEDVVKFQGLIDQDELIPKQKGAHLLLLIIGFDPESRGTVTSKVFEYMACNRPILAIIPAGDAADILQSYPMLHLVQREKDSLLVAELTKAYENYRTERESSPDAQESDATGDNPFNARRQTEELARLFTRNG